MISLMAGIGTVAAKAFVGENRADVPVELHGGGPGEGGEGPGEEQDRCGAELGREGTHLHGCTRGNHRERGVVSGPRRGL